MIESLSARRQGAQITKGGFIQQNKDWVKHFRKQGWNTMKARITGQPAHVVAWLNGVKMTDFTDSRERYPREGYIGLQVHGGAGAWGDQSKARFRNIRLRGVKWRRSLQD